MAEDAAGEHGLVRGVHTVSLLTRVPVETEEMKAV